MMNHSDTTRASRRSILSGCGAMLLLAAPAVAAEAIGASETPFPSIAAMVAELERNRRERDELFAEHARHENGRRVASGSAYFEAVKPLDDAYNRIVLRLSATKAHTPADIRLKAKVAEWHYPFFRYEEGNASAEILRSLFDDLGVV